MQFFQRIKLELHYRYALIWLKGRYLFQRASYIIEPSLQEKKAIDRQKLVNRSIEPDSLELFKESLEIDALVNIKRQSHSNSIGDVQFKAQILYIREKISQIEKA